QWMLDLVAVPRGAPVSRSVVDNGGPPAEVPDPTSRQPSDVAAVPTPCTEAIPAWRPDKGLLPTEQDLLDRADAGEWLSFPCGDEVSPDEMREWGPERTVRAAVLRQLLVEDRWPVHAKGVRLRGARILGHLDLAHARLRCPLVLD